MTQLTLIEPEQLKEIIHEAIEPLCLEVETLIKSAQIAKPQVNSGQSSHCEDLLSRKEACRLLQISHVTLAAWSKNGTLPFYRLNRRVYYKKYEILASMRRIHEN